MGFRAVEIGAVRGDLAPAQLSASGRQEVGRLLRHLGMDAGALTADMGGPGLADPAAVDDRVHQIRMILELAADVRLPMVATETGPLLEPHTGAVSPVAAGALAYLAEHADRVGTVLAVQAGADPPEHLDRALRQIACPSLRVCLDPALLAQSGHDPVSAVGSLAESIALAHLGDATMGGPDRPGREVPLGRGNLDLPGYLAELAAAAYAGPIILRRREAQRPFEELAAARETLRPLIH